MYFYTIRQSLAAVDADKKKYQKAIKDIGLSTKALELVKLLKDFQMSVTFTATIAMHTVLIFDISTCIFSFLRLLKGIAVTTKNFTGKVNSKISSYSCTLLAMILYSNRRHKSNTPHGNNPTVLETLLQRDCQVKKEYFGCE
jgi:hypothetical protein